MNKLFIYIPTYNRFRSVTKQLKIILPKIKLHKNRVRLLVNDNASDKDLLSLAREYKNSTNIVFHRNCGNIGGNANIALGFVFARDDEFLWILSDNDIVKKDAIDYILDVLDDKVDFYCINNEVTRPKTFNYKWEDGCQAIMDWRMGLISAGLYNMSTVKKSIDAAFFYHNSSFPHLAVAFETLKKNKTVTIGLLPQKKIDEGIYDSSEQQTDYSIAFVGMPLLAPLMPKLEAKSFLRKWILLHGIDFYKNRFGYFYLYLQSLAVLKFYGGWRTRIILRLMWFSYFTLYPARLLRDKLKCYLKNTVSLSKINKLKKIRKIIWGK